VRNVTPLAPEDCAEELLAGMLPSTLQRIADLGPVTS
jgi:hypothetical protein